MTRRAAARRSLRAATAIMSENTNFPLRLRCCPCWVNKCLPNNDTHPRPELHLCLTDTCRLRTLLFVSGPDIHVLNYISAQQTPAGYAHYCSSLAQTSTS
ncbi:hypothetical protein J6590_106207 [Homalodisca vitripennis]|nr:hypothetical protein J6590_106207 [Homalodisca vitripennis]